MSFELIRTREEFSAGRDKFGREITLFKTYAQGQTLWSIHREAYNQRNEAVTIDGLTPQNIAAIAQAVQQ